VTPQEAGRKGGQVTGRKSRTDSRRAILANAFCIVICHAKERRDLIVDEIARLDIILAGSDEYDSWDTSDGEVAK
jgi:hypothetical protein